MSAVLDPSALDRLGKLCGMFSSDHLGERATAAAMADQLIRKSGLTWPQVLAGSTQAPHDRHQRAPLSPGEILARHGERLTVWEREFLGSIVRRSCRLSPRQIAVLDDIRQRIRGM